MRIPLCRISGMLLQSIMDDAVSISGTSHARPLGVIRTNSGNAIDASSSYQPEAEAGKKKYQRAKASCYAQTHKLVL